MNLNRGVDKVRDFYGGNIYIHFISLRDNYVKNGDGFLLVYSITSSQSFEEIEDLIEQIMRAKNIDSENPTELSKNLSAVIIGNKADLQNERAVSNQSLQKLGERFKGKIPIFETSAKEKINIEESFMALARQIFDKKTGKQPAKKEGGTSSNSSESCCILL